MARNLNEGDLFKVNVLQARSDSNHGSNIAEAGRQRHVASGCVGKRVELDWVGEHATVFDLAHQRS